MRQTTHKGGQVPSTTSEPLPSLRAARHLFVQLRLFAARMQGRSLPEVKLSGQFDSTLKSITREVLSAAAHELGLQISYEARALSSLEEADFPCLVPLTDGTAFLATGLQNRSVLLVECEGEVKAVAFTQFEQQFSGIVLKFQPASRDAFEVPEDKSASRPSFVPASKARAIGLAQDVLARILKNHRPRLTQLALAAILSNLLLIVLPLFMMSVYDRIIPHLAMETLWALAIGVMVALGVDLGLRVAKSTLVEAIATGVSNEIQGQFYSRLMRLPLKDMPRMAGGLSGAIAEFDQLCRLIPQALVALVIDLPFFIFMLGLLYYMGGAVVIAPVLGLVVIMAVNTITYARARDVNALSTALSFKRNNQMIETVGSIETIKALQSENQLLGKWEQNTDRGAYLGFLARHESALASHVTIITVQLTIVLTLVIGVYELAGGGITMGALAASSLLVGRAMAPMGNLVALVVRGFHMLRLTGVVEQILGAPQERAGDRKRNGDADFKGRINCHKLGFRYEAEGASVLDNLDFSIEPGERVGLIGRIGCGKSTFLKLLPRLYEASAGSLLLDGHDIRQFDPAFLRRHMSFMAQENLLMEGSIRDNILFGRDEIDEEAFERAVKLAGVEDFASVHREGYGLQVGPRGERLSGGERASVVLARAVLRPSKMLLLDEPTAAMDNDLERRIVNNLQGWIGERTFIVATHRAPLLSLVDRIIWLHNGRIIADGPRDEILKKLRG